MFATITIMERMGDGRRKMYSSIDRYLGYRHEALVPQSSPEKKENKRRLRYVTNACRDATRNISIANTANRDKAPLAIAIEVLAANVTR